MVLYNMTRTLIWGEMAHKLQFNATSKIYLVFQVIGECCWELQNWDGIAQNHEGLLYDMLIAVVVLPSRSASEGGELLVKH